MFAEVNITLWGVWGFYQSATGPLKPIPENVTAFVALLEDYVSRVPSGCVFLDDCHMLPFYHGDQALSNLLDAVRIVQTLTGNQSNIIVCLYWDSGIFSDWSRFNFENLSVDFYADTYLRADYADMPETNALSVGVCVWAWSRGWNGLDMDFVRHLYNWTGYDRMIDWSGLESDYYPNSKMRNADLYHFPEWYNFLAELNEQLIEG